MSRSQQILDVSAGLFAERGFHGVSVDDIGTACGISGPALYKHFAGKQDVLEQSLTHISDELLSEAEKRVADADDDTTALEALIGWQVEFALRHPELIIIQEREWAHLRPRAEQHVRRRQLAYLDLWVAAVTGLRDDLTAKEGRAAVQAAIGLINSTPHSARIGTERMREILTTMARAALLTPPER